MRTDDDGDVSTERIEVLDGQRCRLARHRSSGSFVLTLIAHTETISDQARCYIQPGWTLRMDHRLPSAEKVRTADEQSRNQQGLSLKEDCCDYQHDSANEPIESAELEQ